MAGSRTPLLSGPQDPRRSSRFRLGVGGLAILYVGFALASIYRLPPLNGPDEGAHLLYVKVLREQRVMPILPQFTVPGDPRMAEQAQHPPLYYAVLAVASSVLPDYDTASGQRMLKLVSLLLGLVGLLSLARCARELWPDDAVTALTAVGFLALLPLYWVMTSVINNTAGSLAASGLALLFLQRALRGQGRTTDWLAVGVTVGLGLTTKLTAMWLVPVMIVGLWLHVRPQPDKWRRLLRLAAPALLPIVLLVGIWVAHNWLSFGEFLPERVGGRRYLPAGFATIFFLPLARNLLLYVMFVSIPLTTVVPYWLMTSSLRPLVAMAILVAALGPPLVMAIVGAWRRRDALRTSPSPRQALLLSCAFGLLAAWVIAIEAVLHDWNTGLYAGRYAADALPALALCFAAGLRELLPGRKARAVAAAIWLTAFFVLSVLVHAFMYAFFLRATSGGP